MARGELIDDDAKQRRQVLIHSHILTPRSVMAIKVLLKTRFCAENEGHSSKAS